MTDGPRANWVRLRLDTTGVRDKGELMDRLVVTLGLPSWFGRNWDALADCLSEVGHRPGTLLEWSGADDLPVALRQSLDDVLNERAEEGPTPFQVVRSRT